MPLKLSLQDGGTVVHDPVELSVFQQIMAGEGQYLGRYGQGGLISDHTINHTFDIHHYHHHVSRKLPTAGLGSPSTSQT